MTRFPVSIAEALELTGPYRAGGIDLDRQRRLGLSPGDPVDLGDVPALRGIERAGEELRIGAMVTLRELAASPEVRSAYPALATAADTVANPNIRSFATVGGNVLQQVRCDYFGHPDIDCLRKGGSGCPARTDEHAGAVCFDTESCVAPHPSTLAAALLCHDAVADVEGVGTLSMDELLRPATPPANALGPGELLTTFRLPPVWPEERACYLRVATRPLNDWPTVEVIVRVAGDRRIETARVVAGGVAPVPLRLRAVEDALRGGDAGARAFEESARLVSEGAEPLPHSRYRLRLLESAVVEALRRCHPEPGSPSRTETP